jgi:hypothetical protein
MGVTSESAVLRKRGPSLDAPAMVATVASLFNTDRSLLFPVWFLGSSPKTLDALCRMVRSLGLGLVLARLLRSVVSCSPAVSGRRAGNIAAESSL